jgi:hypothetical protein
MSTTGHPIRWGVNAQLPLAEQQFDNMWLPIYGGEVLAAYDENLILRPLIKTQTIESGNTAEFPLTWKVKAERQGAGQEMFGQDTPTGKRTIGLDDRPMVVPLEWDDIDALMSHFEVRSEHSRQAGVALARVDDQQIIRLILNASRFTKPATDTSPFPGGGGSVGHSDLAITGASTPTEKRDAVGKLLELYDQILSQFNDADVPMEGLSSAVPWDLWYALKSYGIPYGSTELATGMLPLFADNRVQGPSFGNLSTLPHRSMPLQYNGINIYNSPSIPTGPEFGDEERYQGDFTNTVGAVWHPDAAARVYKLGIMTEMDRDVRRGSDFMVTKMLAGGGTLRPEAAVEITSVDPA